MKNANAFRKIFMHSNIPYYSTKKTNEYLNKIIFKHTCSRKESFCSRDYSSIKTYGAFWRGRFTLAEGYLLAKLNIGMLFWVPGTVSYKEIQQLKKKIKENYVRIIFF